MKKEVKKEEPKEPVVPPAQTKKEIELAAEVDMLNRQLGFTLSRVKKLSNIYQLFCTILVSHDVPYEAKEHDKIIEWALERAIRADNRLKRYFDVEMNKFDVSEVQNDKPADT